MALDLPFSTEDLARFYCFALLLTGDECAAQQVLHDACVDCAARLGSYRNQESRRACMLGNLRRRAMTLCPGGEPKGIVGAFKTLPEEQRAALAGLYTGLLPARALAEALKFSLEQLGGLLKSAREGLDRAESAIENMEQAP